MPAPKEIIDLVEQYKQNFDAYHGPGYGETQHRQQFINPFFAALGWDMYNKAGLPPNTQEVIHGYGTEVDGSQKEPDYAFRIGEKVKFFVEAKKPAIRIKEDKEPAYQLRKYAYSKQLPISILTNFEKFAAYDGRVKPKENDFASKARVISIAYEEYIEKWDEIYNIFSRDAVWRNRLDVFAEENKGGKHEPLNESFLEMLNKWRDQIARNIANRNHDKNLSKDDVIYAVQAILDRIIFLRVAEARRIEPNNQLKNAIEKENIYKELLRIFHDADERYNSGLFHFHEEKGRSTKPDTLTTRLDVDNGVLKNIIKELYDSPYEFSIVPVEILGQAYEQFLGKTIRLTEGGIAKVEDKPEALKAHGVYYTPEYIVEYIVENTVGELLKQSITPAHVTKLKILDPSCGSGAFLLGSYNCLLQWHLKWYFEDGPEKHKNEIIPIGGEGFRSWRLSIAEKKRILKNNIFGVDIDPQAVEVTKLSLLLKALEGESSESVQTQQKLYKDRVLPDIDLNIKCGNSLIGSDYFSGRQINMLDNDEYRRVNTFDWAGEFPAIIGKGFDVVIGNPPYRKERDFKEEMAVYREYLGTNIWCEGKMDYWYLFLHKALDISKIGSLISFITPSYWLNSSGASKLIRRLHVISTFNNVVDFGNNKIFKKASGKHMIFVISKGKLETKNCHFFKFKHKCINANKIAEILEGLVDGKISMEEFKQDDIFNLDGHISFDDYSILKVISKIEGISNQLQDSEKSFEVSQGVVEAPATIDKKVAEKFGLDEYIGDGVFVVSKDELVSLKLNKYEKGFVKSYLRAQDVLRYYYEYKNFFIFYIGNDDNKFIVKNRSIFPNFVRHLENYKKAITSSNKPYGIHRTRNPKFFVNDKIIGVNMFNKPQFVFCNEEIYVNFAFNVIIKNRGEYSLKYLLGILNSTLGSFWFDIRGKKRGINVDVGVHVLRKFPVKTINFAKPVEKERHERMVSLVETMLSLHKKLYTARTPQEKTLLQRQIESTDQSINTLVYEIYGITHEEKKIIEDSLK